MRKPYSRYSNYWYGVVVKLVQIYPMLDEDDTTEQTIRAKEAIERSLEKTRNMKEGEARIKAVRMIYFDKTHNLDGAAMVLHYHWRTVQNWMNDFIRLVGKEAGYM